MHVEVVKERVFIENKNMENNRISFKFLVENKTDNAGMVAEHGLAIYIEADNKKILFDAGATDIIISNAKALGVDLSEVDLAVISHGHYDHTGGFPSFCDINDGAPIYVHKDAFRQSYGFENGKPEKESCGILWSDSEKKLIETRLVLTDGPVFITDNIAITGTVPVSEKSSITENFYYRNEDGEWVVDDMSHEQCLVINQEEGLYVFSGCSHRGVVSAIEASKTMFPGKRIAVLVAGMHLYSANDDVRNDVIRQISDEEMDRVMPVHCTGIKAICELKALLGDKCIVATAGDVYYGSGR